METVSFLGALWGTYLVLGPLALLFNQRLVQELYPSNDKEAFTYGVFCLMAGVATALLSNTWTRDWTTLVTVFGWVSVLKGLGLMFVPKESLRLIQSVKGSEFIGYGLLVAVLAGLAALYFAFSA